MPLPLPNLDTRRWADLVEEGRSQIPRWAPEWTDHNAHDPGIMLVELFAWLVEQLIYRANRVPERHLRKFLALAGFAPRPPTPSRVVLALRAPGAAAVAVPTGTTWTTTAAGATGAGSPRPLAFRTTAPLTVVPAQLVAAQTFDGARFADRTRALRDGAAFAPLGTDPRPPSPYTPGAAPALLLGFDAALAAGVELTLWLHAPTRADDDCDAGVDCERARLLAEAAERAAACAPPFPCTPCERAPDAWCYDAREDADDDASARGGASSAPGISAHHQARVAWDYLAADGWHELRAAAGELADETRAITLPGTVRLTLPAPTAARPLGAVASALHWVRCRVVAGPWDETPMLLGVLANAAVVEQARQAWERFRLAPGAVVDAAVVAGARTPLALAFDGRGRVTSAAPAAIGSGAPTLLVVERVAPTATDDGALALDVARIGEGTGLPDLETSVPIAPVARGAAAVHTIEGGAWRRWSPRVDLDASGDRDAHVALEPSAGTLRFGDGVHGRVPPAGAAVVAAYAATTAAAARVAPRSTWAIGGDAYDRAAAGGAFATLATLAASNAFASDGGRDAETVGHAAARAAASLWAHERLVALCPAGPCETLDQLDRGTVLARPAPFRAATTLDVERIALDVPGTRLRRARAWAELDAMHPCATVPGTVTLVVVPSLPAGRPTPSAGLLRAVSRWLERRRVLCTRIVVVGPTYVEVRARAAVRARPSADPARVRDDVARAVTAFLDPLAGGPAGRGWPFGRDVYRTEILQVIDGVAGVDHVDALTLFGGDREATCGNVCVPATSLVASAAHEISVEGAR